MLLLKLRVNLLLTIHYWLSKLRMNNLCTHNVQLTNTENTHNNTEKHIKSGSIWPTVKVDIYAHGIILSIGSEQVRTNTAGLHFCLTPACLPLFSLFSAQYHSLSVLSLHSITRFHIIYKLSAQHDSFYQWILRYIASVLDLIMWYSLIVVDKWNKPHPFWQCDLQCMWIRLFMSSGFRAATSTYL